MRDSPYINHLNQHHATFSFQTSCTVTIMITHPDNMISSSMPYSFICCNPHPSLIRFGMNRFRRPVRFGVWYSRICTRSAPKSAISGARRDAVVGFGVSRVPRSASTRKETRRFGFRVRAVRMVEIWVVVSEACFWYGRGDRGKWEGKYCTSSCSDLPMYSVER